MAPPARRIPRLFWTGAESWTEIRNLILSLVLALSILSVGVAEAQTPPPPQSVVIGGLVSNKTTGAFVAGQEVTLVFAEGTQPLRTLTATSDSSGRFQFTLDGPVTDTVYQLSATYNGVPFNSDLFQFDAGATTKSVDVNVYEPTSSNADIQVQQASVVVMAADGAQKLLNILEVVAVKNSGSRAYVGNTLTDKENGSVLKFTVPQGASNLPFGHSFGPDDVVTTPDGFASKTPVVPGVLQTLFAYTLPYDEADFVLNKTYPYDVPELRFMITDSGIKVNSKQLKALDPVTLNNLNYLVFSAQGLKAGSAFPIELSGLPLSAATDSGRTSFMGSTMGKISVGLMALAVVAAVALFLVVRRRGPTPVAVTEQEPLVSEREALLKALAEMDEDLDTGRITKEQYETERSAKKQRLLDIATQLGEEAKE